MRNGTIVIGTRSSKLALWQADFVADAIKKQYPELKVEKRLMTTKGDRILDAPLAKIGGKGLFTKELELEMLEGGIDLAVHSLKDMPTEIPEGLIIASITKRFDPGDVMVSNSFDSFEALPEGAKVGTSSLRRKAQLLAIRPDLDFEDLRGNVNTRLRKLDEGHYDAIILAAAGLKRLGFGDRITQLLPRKYLLPAVGQGALAIETRSEDGEVRGIVAFLDDGDTRACACAERAFLAKVEGGCQVPVGVYAEPNNDNSLSVEAVIASLDGKRIYRDQVSGSREDGEILGRNLAAELLDMGGRDILHELGLL